MQVHWIAHSGFLIETDAVTLLFDYWKGALPAVDPAKPLLVFSSHAHRDHFDFSVFPLVAAHPDAQFVLSSDIRRFGRKAFLINGATEAQYGRIQWVKPHQTLTVGAARVETLGSTDAGVAFLVTVGEETVFHAGDLNLWLWDDDTPEEAADMERRYMAELARVRGRRITAAFLPLDPRLGARFADGFDRFLGATNTLAAYPMHFWEDGTAIDRLLERPESAPYRDRVRRPGTTLGG